MQIINVISGLSLGTADRIRRSLGKRRTQEQCTWQEKNFNAAREHCKTALNFQNMVSRRKANDYREVTIRPLLLNIMGKQSPFYMGIIYLSFLEDIIPHWSMDKMRLATSLCYVARRTGAGGRHLTVGFASPLSRLRSTHGYALVAAYAALLCW